MGVFVSFEGGDGSGKRTQSMLLHESLLSIGVNSVQEGFPRYDTPVGRRIGEYLNGEFGTNVDPRLASSLYSFDRLHAAPLIKATLEDPLGAFLADRFNDSNKGHQGGRLASDEARLAYFAEQDAFEHDGLGIPKPDKTILLPVSPHFAQLYIDKKAARSYTDKKRDIHEADLQHLENAAHSYELLAKHEPDRIIVINPMNQEQTGYRPIMEIQTDIVIALRPLFQERLGIELPLPAAA